MTPEYAYKLLSKIKPAYDVGGCLDFGKFYVFCLIPFYNIGDETYDSGTVFDAVDKRTGKIFEYDLTSDPDAYNNAKEIDIKTIFDTKI